MRAIELSEEQERLLGSGIRVVDACPGSGKTRALVARFLDTATSSERGVAIVSFTNAAVDEVRRRTRNAPALLQAPHFVGTIDAFLHRFIVTPAVIARLGRPPSYWASWDDLDDQHSTIRLKNLPGIGIPLSAFRLDLTSSVTLNEDALDRLAAAYLREVDAVSQRNAVLSQADTKIRTLLERGTYDASTARLEAYRILQGSAGDALVARLALRFGHLLVDEAQDCDEAEIAIITRLAAAGMATLVVADPDQAIYEFRGSDPAVFLDYRDRHPEHERATLATNYRSTKAICAAISTLRSGDVAANEQGDCAPVYLLGGDSGQQRMKFLALLDEHGVELNDAIVLAHASKDAHAVAGVPLNRRAAGGAAGDRLAMACSTLRDSRVPAERIGAVQGIERIILSLLDWPEELRGYNQREQLSALGRPSQWIRRAAAGLVTATENVADAAAFALAARDELARTLGGLPIPTGKLSARLKKPSSDTWNTVTQNVPPASVIRSATIHAAKGAEFKAVLLALPARLRKTGDHDVLDDWQEGRNSEPRRVLYVGASRAERVLAFGAGPHLARVEATLRERGVTIEIR